MTETDVITFPGSIAVIAAIFLVVSAFTALVFSLVGAIADWSSRRT